MGSHYNFPLPGEETTSGTCPIEGCSKPRSVTYKTCGMHYMRMYRTGSYTKKVTIRLDPDNELHRQVLETLVEKGIIPRG